MNATSGGWIAVSRGLLDPSHDLHPSGTAEEACRLAAWIDLIGLAQYRPRAGLDVGEVRKSERDLARRWNWSKGRVRRFLELLERDHRIRRYTNGGGPRSPGVIELVNFSTYQPGARGKPGSEDVETVENSENGGPRTDPRNGPRNGPHGGQSSQQLSALDEPHDGPRTGPRTDPHSSNKEKTSTDNMSDPERHVFDLFVEERKLRVPGALDLKPTGKRLGKIRARLNEGLTVEQAELVVRGIFRDPYHVEQRFKYATIDVAFRSLEHCERFIRNVRPHTGARPEAVEARKPKTYPADCTVCGGEFELRAPVDTPWTCPTCTPREERRTVRSIDEPRSRRGSGGLEKIEAPKRPTHEEGDHALESDDGERDPRDP